MDITTTYMGLKLRSPLVVGASPMSEDIKKINEMEKAGAAAVVLQSLFEEQLRQERIELQQNLERGTLSSPESLSFFPEPEEYSLGPEEYLKHITRAKKAVKIPIIASLNGSTMGGWTKYARLMQEAGADAVELNIYHIPTDMNLASDAVEKMYLDIVRAVKSEVKIPVAVKVSPFFTNFANMAHRLDEAGADGLVLFNRFYQPDIDLDGLTLRPNLLLSTPMAMRLPLRWIALLYSRVRTSLAATSGVHHGTDAVKMLLVGADVTMLCSAILRHGIGQIGVIEKALVDWMEKNEYQSVTQLKGSMSQKNSADPGNFERVQYVRSLSSYSLHPMKEPG